MATYTENYNLTIPEEDDYYNVEDFNENFETIDALMAESESSISEMNKKIGTPAESGQTLFSLLQNNNAEGLSVIKSLQHITITMTKSATSTSANINPIDPSKCIVLFERLYDSTEQISKVIYTLNSTSISCAHSAYASDTITCGFWIIEFC